MQSSSRANTSIVSELPESPTLPPENSRGEDFTDVGQLPRSPIRTKPADLQPLPATSTFQQQLTSPSGKLYNNRKRVCKAKLVWAV